jgi:rare lipoprotein A (peptidoglycan hydrolase)
MTIKLETDTPDVVHLIAGIGGFLLFGLVFILGMTLADNARLNAERLSLESDISANAETMSTLTDRLINVQAALTFEVRASYYGHHEAGNTTANMEIFDPNGLTAASKWLPFNSTWRVTNLTNGKSVVVRINDDGPNVKGRGLDLSLAAARAIGMLRDGVVNVRLEPGI